MEEKKFHREEYPLDILSDFGLTAEMIYDLPDFVHETIEMGGKSPLLPIKVQEPYGFNHGYAKFSLIENEFGLDVVFYPQLKQANLDEFTPEQQVLLRDGKVIVAQIEDTFITSEGVEDVQVIKAFVQLDRDTNDIVYSPTHIIGKNLNAICNEFELTGDDLLRFWDGNLVTVMDKDEDETDRPVTIGVDLSTENGVLVVPGTAYQWEKVVRRTMPEYCFGNDGCWVNKSGVLTYVPDDEFTPEILNQLTKASQRVSQERGVDIETLAKEVAQGQDMSSEVDESRQLTR